MKRTIKDIKERYEKSKTERIKFEKLYEDVYKFGTPDRYNNIKPNRDGTVTSNREEIFSSVLEQSCNEFVQRLQSLLCPVNMDWIDFEAGYIYTADPNNRAFADVVNQNLGEAKKACNAYKACSNYDAVFTEMAFDVIAGTGVMSCVEGTPDNPLNFIAIPFKDISIEDGVNGEACAYYRHLCLPNEQIKKQWASANYSYEKGKETEKKDLLEATYYDDTDRVWRYVVIDDKEEKVIVEKTSFCSPFIDLRWSKCAGETYGRGPGLQVINDFKTLNKIKEYSLRALSFTVPSFTAVADGVFDPDKFLLKPGAISPVGSNATNNPTIKQLEVNPMPDLSNYQIDKLTMEIKRNMYASTIPDEPSKMTATEIMRRTQELDSSLNNAFGRLLSFLQRLIPRMIEVLKNFGFIDKENKIDVRQFNGFGFKIKINTRLANQQNMAEVDSTLNAIGTLLQADPTGQMLDKSVKLDELIPDILVKMGLDRNYVRTEAERREYEANKQQAMLLAQQQAMINDVDVSNAKEQGKADAQRYARQGM